MTETSKDYMGFQAHCVPRTDCEEVSLYQSHDGFIVSRGFSVNKAQAAELASMLEEFSKS